jgi:hypothetical protein
MRFRLATAFLAIAFLASWLATTQVEWRLGRALRQIHWFLTFAIPVFCAVHHRARMRAFWVGFVLVLVLCAVPDGFPLSRYKPNLVVVDQLAISIAERGPQGSYQVIYFILSDSFALLIALTLGGVSGLVSASIYSHAQGLPE